MSEKSGAPIDRNGPGMTTPPPREFGRISTTQAHKAAHPGTNIQVNRKFFINARDQNAEDIICLGYS